MVFIFEQGEQKVTQEIKPLDEAIYYPFFSLDFPMTNVQLRWIKTEL